MWQRGCALLRACGGPGLFAAAVLAQPSSAASCLGLDGSASAAHANPRAWLRDARDGDGALFERALGVRAEAGLPRLDNMLLFGACEAVRAGRARARGRRRAARRGGGDPRVHIFFPFSFRSASGGSANEELGEEVAYELNAPLGRMKLGRYADGEISVQVLDNVRGKDVVRVPSRLRGARSSGDARRPRPPPLACAPAAAPPPYAPNFSLSCSRRRSP